MLNKLRGLGRLTGAKVDHPLADPREMRRIIDQEREHVRQLEAVRAEGAPPEMGNA